MTPNFRAIICAVVTAAMLLALLPAHAQTGSSQDTLNQYVSDLQKNPTDTALREKIIKLAQEMRPAPALPDEAQKHLDRGVAAIEGAKSEEDFKDACAEFTKVLTIAPWFGRGYRPLAVAQDKAGQYDAALKNLEFYLLSQPSPEDAAWAKSLINKIEYRKEKGAKEAEAKAKESSPEAIAAREQKKSEDWLKKLDGRRYRETRGGAGYIEVRGKFLVMVCPGCDARLEIRGRIASTPRTMQQLPFPVQTTYTISEDGDRIIEHRDFIDGDMGEFVWLWQR